MQGGGFGFDFLKAVELSLPLSPEHLLVDYFIALGDLFVHEY